MTHFSEPKAKPGVPKVRALCTKCGYEGLSQNPQFYQCGACYYAAWAKADLAKAIKLETRAQQFYSDCERHKAQAAKARAAQDKKKIDSPLE